MDNQKRMQIIADNITFYRKNRGITQKELAKEIGISASTMTDYMKLRSAPSFGVIQKIADFFGVKKSDIDSTFKEEVATNSSPTPNSTLQAINDTVVQLHQDRQEIVLDVATEQLEEQQEETTVEEESAGYEEKVIQMPSQHKEYESLIVHGLESAGDGIWQEEDADIEVRIPKDEIPDKFDDLAMVIGDSMRPKLHNGDILFISFTKQIEIGKIGVFRTSKGNFVKRLQSDRLESLNPDYDDIYFSENEFAEAIGIVEDVYRK